jgi:hypothetical protein
LQTQFISSLIGLFKQPKALDLQINSCRLEVNKGYFYIIM